MLMIGARIGARASSTRVLSNLARASTLGCKQFHQTSFRCFEAEAPQSSNRMSVEDTIKIIKLVRAFRIRGHLIADLDPLGLSNIENVIEYPDLGDEKLTQGLDYKDYGFTEADLDKFFYVGSEFGTAKTIMTLGEIVGRLKKTYCGNISFELRHLFSKESKDWLVEKIEADDFLDVTTEDRKRILIDLAKADRFETFLARKHPAVKRFGLEGGESTIVGIQSLLNRGAELGLESVVIGMSHRGRLNVLGNVVGKPLHKIFSEFDPPSPNNGNVEGSGDVKYHLGTSSTVTLANGHRLHLSLTANPSHLEAVNPVVVGKTRAKQHWSHDKERTKVLGLMIHGDAAFAGQGVVAETLALSDLHNYKVGGCIHIIINNQVGFTTDPRKARSSPFPSDVAKMTGCPIFHVNGDNPEAVAKACRIAIEYRMKFHSDVVIDIFCYRRHGHNESDEPTFTQPLMYAKIKNHASTLELYKKRLLEEKALPDTVVHETLSNIDQHLENEYQLSRQPHVGKPSEWLENRWKGIKSLLAATAETWSTAVSPSEIEIVGKAITTLPHDFNIHKGIKRVLEARKQMFESGQGFDWGTAEALAFGTLHREKFHVRLSGQDCERGTFSHRHAAMVDQVNERSYVPLAHLEGAAGDFSVSNSNLSEFACLGFELGYSLEHPNCLVIWEAQFGDFANGAQIIIDNFISSGEQKWLRQTGITLLLPHGYDGQGPEHSSARLERYLRLCDDADDYFPPADMISQQEHRINMQVVNLTTPANYFHCLRRQMKREFRKPLIVMSPKSLLRHKQCASSIDEFTKNEFMRVIPEQSHDIVAPAQVRRILFCSGKVYYDLLDYRKEKKINDVVLVRVEQIAPFPFDLLLQEINKYPMAELVWCQEEPKNSGAWIYVRPRFETTIQHSSRHVDIKYVGRGPSAAPATGSAKIHKQETDKLFHSAFSEHHITH